MGLATLLCVVVLGSLAATITPLAGILARPPTCASEHQTVAVPTAGSVLLGFSFDRASETADDVAAALGDRAPAVVVEFATVPYDRATRASIMGSGRTARSSGAAMLLTLEPRSGLAAVDASVVDGVTADLRILNEEGVPVIVRFAHEMNGAWYPWGQQPEAYLAAFRAFASAVHNGTPATAMMWAPSYGGGYPFRGGSYAADPGTPDFTTLDTTTDGVLDMHDDPYGPYYPGDDVVDWVGVSLYHWGTRYPWGENEEPEPGKFAAMLRGEYVGPADDESALPDFYETYAVGHAKPLAISETGAFFTPPAPPGSELRIKSAWWRQVFGSEAHREFPAIKMINWFEWRKVESETQSTVDWRVLADPTVRRHFVADLPPWLTVGGGFPLCG